MAARKIVKQPKAARRKKVEAKSKGLCTKETRASLDGLELAKLIESDGSEAHVKKLASAMDRVGAS